MKTQQPIQNNRTKYNPAYSYKRGFNQDARINWQEPTVEQQQAANDRLRELIKKAQDDLDKC